MTNKLERLMKEAETLHSVGANSKQLKERYGLYGYIKSYRLRLRSKGAKNYVAYFLCDSDTKKVVTGVIMSVSKTGQTYRVIDDTKTVLYGRKQRKEWEDRCKKRW